MMKFASRSFINIEHSIKSEYPAQVISTLQISLPHTENGIGHLVKPIPTTICKNVSVIDAKTITETEKSHPDRPVFDETLLRKLFFTRMGGEGSCGELESRYSVHAVGGPAQRHDSKSECANYGVALAENELLDRGWLLWNTPVRWPEESAIDNYISVPVGAGIFGWGEAVSAWSSQPSEMVTGWVYSARMPEESISTESFRALEGRITETGHNLFFITDQLTKLEAFFIGCEVKIKQLAYKLVGTAWEVENPIFCISLLASIVAQVKMCSQCGDFETDKKADSNSHFHGLRLPPPSTCRRIVTSLVVATILLSVKGGVSTGMFLINCDGIKGGRLWKKQRKSLNEVCRPGKEQVRKLGEKPKKPTSKLVNSFKRTLTSKRRQVPCCSISMLSSSKEDTLKPSVSFLCLPSVCFMLADVRKRANRFVSRKARSRLGYRKD